MPSRAQPEVLVQPHHAGSARGFAGSTCGSGVWGYLWSWVHMGWVHTAMADKALEHLYQPWAPASSRIPARWSCRGISRVQGELPVLGTLAGPWVPVLGRQQDVGAPRLGCGCSEIVPCVSGCRGARCGEHPGRNADLAVPVAPSILCFCLCYWKSRALRCRQW